MNNLDINKPGNGVIFICSLSSFGGKRELNLCLQCQKILERDEKVKDHKYELIIIIANIGYSNTIMSFARKNGAKGGTLLHGKKANEHENDDFLGVSVVQGKEIILIVAYKNKHNNIMESVMENCGIDTEIGAICFSLPVIDLCGFSLLKE